MTNDEVSEALRQARAAHQRLDAVSERLTRIEAIFEVQLKQTDRLLQQLVESQSDIPKTLARLGEQVRQLAKRLDQLAAQQEQSDNGGSGGAMSWVVMSLGWLFALVMFILKVLYK